MNCPKCNDVVWKDGFHLRGDERQQRYRCKCGATFYDPAVPRPSMRGRANRNRKRPQSFRDRVSRGLRRRQESGLSIGAPRKNPIVNIRCAICGDLVIDRVHKTRVVCSKIECKVARANQGRRKLPPDDKIAEIYNGGLTSPEIAEMFGTTHGAVLDALRRAGCPRRRVGPRVRACCIEPGCQKRVYRTWHKKLRVWYGKRCKDHHFQHRLEVRIKYEEKKRSQRLQSSLD